MKTHFEIILKRLRNGGNFGWISIKNKIKEQIMTGANLTERNTRSDTTRIHQRLETSII